VPAGSLHEVREFAGHAAIRATEPYFVRKEEDAEVAARRIRIRVTGRKSEWVRGTPCGGPVTDPQRDS
jgi:hypothetical protein